MTSLATVAALLAAVPLPAPSPPRFQCDAGAHELLWAVGDAVISASERGLELAAGGLTSPGRPLAPSGTQPAVTVTSGSESVTLRGVQAQACAGRKCSALGRLPVTVWAALGGADGVLLAGGAPQPGLYRATLATLLEPEMLVAGEVLALCPRDGGAWALVMRDSQAVLAAASTSGSEPTISSFGEATLAAIRSGSTPVHLLQRALAVALDRGLPEAEALALAVLGDPRPAARALAAPIVARAPGAAAAAAMVVLAHDAEPEVRRAALAAAAGAGIAPATTRSHVALFIDDSDQDIAWYARDLLLAGAPQIALLGASAAYKLDAIAILAARRQRAGRDAVHGALRLLLADEDPEVRAAALLVDIGSSP